MTKFAIIVSNRIEKCPYVGNYTKIFNKEHIEYDIICWNRENEYESSSEKIVFNYYSPESTKLSKKILDYRKFKAFVGEYLKKRQYDYLIVHDMVLAVFLFKELKRKKFKYIFDIRDYSPIYPFTRGLIKKIIHNSLFTTISSPGYLKWLPSNEEYVLDHNIRDIPNEDYSNDRKFSNKYVNNNKLLTVLTIGQIRDFSVNSKLIDALANNKDIKLLFAGNGNEKERLEEYAKRVANNAEFLGEYKKVDEQEIVKSADVLNILLPRGVAFDTPLSNRFYLALLLKKPIITNNYNLHADYVKKYKLGIVIDSIDDLYNELMKYFQNFNHKEFIENCNIILSQIQNDKENFENRLTKGIKRIEDRNTVPNL